MKNVLDGSPYLLPEDASDAVLEAQRRLRAVRSKLRDGLDRASRMGLISELDRVHAYWTVFESNQIEFSGPDLAGTVEAIESDRGRSAIENFSLALLPDVFVDDRDAYAAISLESARTLAMRLVGDGLRGITQADLRALHAVVKAESIFAGSYRTQTAEILDAGHKPFPGDDIPIAMAELAEWSRRPVDDDDAIVRAAAAHAWFTHVHPFYDGNGRVGRLLTNTLLGQDGLPPAIVKARTQRSRYIAALAHSDEGGDLMPLVGLFLETMERYVADISHPQAFKRLFDQLVARRGEDYFDWYAACMKSFLSDLRGQLAVVGLKMTQLDRLTREVFESMRSGRRGDVLAAVISDGTGQELVIYYTAPSRENGARYRPDERVPSLEIGLPASPWSLNPYRRARPSEVQALSEFWVQPERRTVVHVRDAFGTRRFSQQMATVGLAEYIQRSFARRFAIPTGFVTSERWLPKIAGGPG